jgi:formamidopyrimidine-DNA glycosylase
VPELPEVETVRRGLEQQTTGSRIDSVQVLLPRVVAAPADPTAFAQALEGTTLQGWQRRGKYLLGQLIDPADRPAGLWGVHLRMTGQFLLPAPDAPICPHTRVRIRLAEGRELRFVDTRSFGRMWWVPPGTEPEAVIGGLGRLGPEPFATDFTATYLRRRLRGSARPIKNALLDQSLVAGVGNIYADEALFTAGIRPHTPAGRLGAQRLQRLRDALVRVLERSIGAGGTTFRDFHDLTGRNGNYGAAAWVYRRQGAPCRRCGGTVQRTRLAGRSTHWCPHCQR